MMVSGNFIFVILFYLLINLIKRWIMKTWKVEAAIIAVGMVLLGVIIKWGIK